MITLTILLQIPGQTVPRPFNRAGSIGEAAEMIETWGQRVFGDDLEINEANVDTEEPVLVYPWKGSGYAKLWVFADRF